MRFFFPDSQDQVDPHFDFLQETHPVHRVRQRDDRYCHEVLGRAPYDGVLVSKSIVDGRALGAARYTMAQKQRFYRDGVRHFFRLGKPGLERVVTMGDCGAFTYHREAYPPFTVDEVIDFYCTGFDFGVSIDHVILGFDASLDTWGTTGNHVPDDWAARQSITLELAVAFLARCQQRSVQFTPVGVAQGWSPLSYQSAVRQLCAMGYTQIGLGGMVPLKTPEILASLKAVNEVLPGGVGLHLFGIARTDSVPRFAKLGVTSFDSTSPFLQAFKDATDNYYTTEGAYVAIRVPQVGENLSMKRRILAGEIRQERAMELEEACLSILRAYDRGEASLDAALDLLETYEDLCTGQRKLRAAYARTLGDRPWKACGCAVCRQSSVEVVIYRGSERNKRRGFHNVYVFEQRLRGGSPMGAAA